MFVWSLCKVLARACDGVLCTLSGVWAVVCGCRLRVFMAWDWVVFVPRVVFSVDTKRGHEEWVIYDL